MYIEREHGDGSRESPLLDNHSLPPTVHVLVVEDCDEDFYTINRLLQRSERKQFSVSRARSVDEAGWYIEGSHGVDAIIVDYFLGQRKGIELLGKLDGIATIILSGQTIKLEEERTLFKRAHDLLDKDSLTDQQLFRSIEFALEKVNIDRRLKVEREGLLRLRDEAVKASEAKSAFLSEMSHELRTPLNAIIGFSEIIGGDIIGEGIGSQYKGYAQDINQSAARLLGLINDLLDLSKIEAGKRELQIGKIDIRLAINDAQTVIRPFARKRSVKIQQTIPSDMISLNADPQAFDQMLLNLMSNAVKFCERSSTINIFGRQTRDHDVIGVFNKGIGMTDAEIEKIVQPFAQLPDKNKLPKTQGTGLGLAITKSLIEQHGGKMKIESELDVGVQFSLLFPRSR